MSDIIDAKIAKIDAFCAILSKLCKLMCAKEKDSKIAVSVKVLVEQGIKHQPEYVITKMGPYLYDYRDKIIARDSAFFKQLDYDKEYGNKKNYNKEAIDMIRRLSNSFTAKETDMIIDTVQSALKLYLEYILLEKDIK